MSKYHSQILNDVVEELTKLPSIGRKSALRLALHLVYQKKDDLTDLSRAIEALRDKLLKCERCNNISDTPVCAVCTDTSRTSDVLCVVESIRDLIAIEETEQYHGKYYVLSGLISPIEGIGPEELRLHRLQELVVENEVKELVLAVSPTFEGDTTVFYISKMLKDYEVRITTLARGVSFGSELEYTDEITLGRSLQARVPYDHVFKNDRV